MNFLSSILIFFIRLYQKTISPLLPNCCRFEPSCSNYGIEAIKMHGPIKGSWLTAKRILKCNPFGPTGNDPVPKKE